MQRCFFFFSFIFIWLNQIRFDRCDIFDPVYWTYRNKVLFKIIARIKFSFHLCVYDICSIGDFIFVFFSKAIFSHGTNIILSMTFVFNTHKNRFVKTESRLDSHHRSYFGKLFVGYVWFCNVRKIMRFYSFTHA